VVLDRYAEEWILPTSLGLALVLAMLHTSPCKEERQVDDQQQSRSQPTRKQILWTVGILAVIVVIVGFAYVYEWEWTGLVKDPHFHKRTLWEWLNLLIVPAVLALGGYLFTRSENRRTREDAVRQRRLDRELAEDRRQDDTLQAYLDGMSQLLTDKELPLHRTQSGDSLSTVARARNADSTRETGQWPEEERSAVLV
jgi:hypothetical protein